MPVPSVLASPAGQNLDAGRILSAQADRNPGVPAGLSERGYRPGPHCGRGLRGLLRLLRTRALKRGGSMPVPSVLASPAGQNLDAGRIHSAQADRNTGVPAGLSGRGYRPGPHCGRGLRGLLLRRALRFLYMKRDMACHVPFHICRKFAG